jgi:hypothetical protein
MPDLDASMLEGTAAQVIDGLCRKALAGELVKWDEGRKQNFGVVHPLSSDIALQFGWTALARPDEFYWSAGSYVGLSSRESAFLELLMVDGLPRAFHAAINPIVKSLYLGELTAAGIPEQSGFEGWEHKAIPNGVFRVGRWRLYHLGSRLTALGPDGEEVSPAWGDVRLRLTAPSVPRIVFSAASCSESGGADLFVPHSSLRAGRQTEADDQRRKIFAEIIRSKKWKAPKNIQWLELLRSLNQAAATNISVKTLRRDIEKLGGFDTILGSGPSDH